MNVRVTEFGLQTSKIDEAGTMYQNAMEEALQYEGFIRGMLLTDRDTGKAFSITLWESEAAEEASRQSLHQVQLVKFARVMTGSPTSGNYELIYEG
jgi:heme-degrading monooxygenase HmoA